MPVTMVELRAPVLYIGAGDFAGDPFRFAGGERSASIQAHGELQAHKGSSAFDSPKKTVIELARFLTEQADVHVDARRTHSRDGRAFVLETVFAGDYHTTDAGTDQGIGAGRRAAMQSAGFEGDVGGRFAGEFARRAQGVDFGMGFPCTLVPAFTDHNAIAYQDAANAGVRLSRVQPVLGQTQCALHVLWSATLNRLMAGASPDCRQPVRSA